MPQPLDTCGRCPVGTCDCRRTIADLRRQLFELQDVSRGLAPPPSVVAKQAGTALLDLAMIACGCNPESRSWLSGTLDGEMLSARCDVRGGRLVWNNASQAWEPSA